MSDSESELLIHEDEFSPCDGCEPTSCSSCSFASSSINDSLNYYDDIE